MRKEKGGKRGKKMMDDREKESEVEERVEVTEGGIERSAILQPREPGCVQLLLTVRKFPLWNL